MSQNPYDPNPYASPVAPSDVAVGVLSGSRADLRSIAQCQKGIITCLGVYLLLVVFQFAIPPNLRLYLALLFIPLVLTSLVLTILLSLRVYGLGIGILLGILTLVPCVNLLVLLLVNGKATNVLKANGVQVGFFGAKQPV